MSVTTEARKIADEQPTVSLNGHGSKPANVVEAIARVMVELPAIGKTGQAAASQGGYAYRGIEAITSEAQSLFGKYGVVFVPQVRAFEIKDITVAGKPWTDTILTVEYTVYGPGGVDDQIVVGPLIAVGRDNSDKGANKAMTQAFKYALIQVLCISDKKDDSDGSTHEAEFRQPPPLPVLDPEAEEAMHELVVLMGELDETVRDTVRSHLRGRFGPSSEMTLEQIREAQLVVAGWPSTAQPNSDPFTESPDLVHPSTNQGDTE
jgi:hypothetical protein